jgi:Kelch motif
LRALLCAALAAAAVAGCGGDSGGRSGTSGEAAEWTYGRAMSSRRSYIAAAEVAGEIYVAGGMVGETGRPLATFQRYDPAADSWTTLSRLPVATRAAAAAAVDGVVYVIGGTTPDGNTTAVWAWNGDEWERKASLPEPRFNHAAVAVGSQIWVLGGFAGGAEHDEVFVYDTENDGWRRSQPLPRPNHAFGALALGDEIWILGGRRGDEILSEVWIFATAGSGGWRRGPAMPKPMELLGTAFYGDRIHAVWESVYQIYDLVERRWRQGPHPLVTRHGLEVFAIDEELFAIGGCTTALRDSPVVERLELF